MNIRIISTLLAFLFTTIDNVWACSSCLVGDPTITQMGTGKPYAGRLRMAVSTLSRSETTGEAGVNERETEEQRLALSLAWSPNPELTLGIDIPYVSKQMDDISLAQAEATGLGDAAISAKWFIYQDRTFASRHMAGLLLGLQLPTSEEQTDQAGEALDIDVQPGPGSWIPSIGAWYGHYAYPWSLYGSVQFRHALDEGHQQFRPGDAWLLTVNSQYQMRLSFAVNLGLDARWSAHDEYDLEEDSDSGGFIGFLSPGFAYRPGGEWIIHGRIQLPLFDHLNGNHQEHTTYLIGVTYDLENHKSH
jgi:hypothetical protein